MDNIPMCSICYEYIPLKNNFSVSVLDCVHIYHDKCLRTCPNCPNCRKTISDVDLEIIGFTKSKTSKKNISSSSDTNIQTLLSFISFISELQN